MRSHSVNPSATRRIYQRLTRQRLLLLATLVIVLVGGWFLGRWWLARYRIQYSIDYGLRLLEQVASPDEVPAQLAHWEQQTAQYWQHRPDALISALYSSGRLADWRTRALLACVSGADYRDRREDWERWYESRRRLQAGKAPEVPRRDRVTLEPLWRAPVGLTGWFSTIIPLDGQIYVGSLGAAVGVPDDPGDGVVRVDGLNGEAALLFSPPDREPRDVLGIARSDDGLFVACRNAFVYNVALDGELLWRCYAVSTIVSAPLSVDLNDDDVLDAIVVTEAGTVVAISGRTGNTPWVRQLPGGPPATTAPTALVQAALAAGDLLPAAGLELLVTTADGDLYVLSARDGRVLWQYGVAPGLFSTPVVFGGAADGQTCAIVADGNAGIWGLVRSGNGLLAHRRWTVGVRRGERVDAGLRTTFQTGEPSPYVIAATSRPNGTPGGSVCLLGPDGLVWRFPPGGIIWGTPAVADLNGDDTSEIIVTSVQRDADANGLLTVISRTGHVLRQVDLPAALECGPVVADVTGDARRNVLVADQAGFLHCYGTPSTRAVEWGLPGGDPTNSRQELNAYDWGQSWYGHQQSWRPQY